MATTSRREEYLVGGNLSPDKKDATVVDQKKIIGLSLYFSSRIPPQFFVATAVHESELITNKIVTDSGRTFNGLYQLSNDVLTVVGMSGSLIDPLIATRVAAALYEKRLDVLIVEALKKQTVIKDDDVWAYLAIANHQGPVAAVTTISKYGLNWAEYKKRNPGSKFVLSHYGDDVVTGGPTWKCPC